MFWDLFFRKSAKSKEEGRLKPRAVAFVDYEHWYIALDNLYGIRPDIKGWRDELAQKYDLSEIIIFADFSNPSLRAEISRIREVTNIIIETQNSSPTYAKDFTDFTGDGHFSSAVSFIMNRLNKPVVIYGVRNSLSNQLRNTASEVYEIPAVAPAVRRGFFGKGERSKEKPHPSRNRPGGSSGSKAKAEKFKVDKEKTEKAKLERQSGKKSGADKAKPEPAKPDKAAAEPAKSAPAKPKKKNDKKTKAEKTKPKKGKAEAADTEKAKAERLKAEQSKADKAKAEKAKAEAAAAAAAADSAVAEKAKGNNAGAEKSGQKIKTGQAKPDRQKPNPDKRGPEKRDSVKKEPAKQQPVKQEPAKQEDANRNRSSFEEQNRAGPTWSTG